MRPFTCCLPRLEVAACRSAERPSHRSGVARAARPRRGPGGRAGSCASGRSSTRQSSVRMTKLWLTTATRLVRVRVADRLDRRATRAPAPGAGSRRRASRASAQSSESQRAHEVRVALAHLGERQAPPARRCPSRSAPARSATVEAERVRERRRRRDACAGAGWSRSQRSRARRCRSARAIACACARPRSFSGTSCRPSAMRPGVVRRSRRGG